MGGVLTKIILTNKYIMKKVLFTLAIALGLTQTIQAQMNSLCDSTWYEVSFSGGMSQMNLWDITLTGYYDTTIHNYGVDTVTHTFSVENDTWVGSSGYTIFDMNLSLYDTLSICWIAELWLTPTNSLFNWEWCQDTAQGYTQCDDWVYDFQNQVWTRSTEIQQTVSLEEYNLEQTFDNKIYDMLGKELSEAPIGQMYIQNRKLYFRNE